MKIMGVIGKQKSQIVVKQIAKSKKKMDITKSENHKNAIIRYLDDIIKLFEEVDVYYGKIMHEAGIAEDDSAQGLDVSTDIGASVNGILLQIQERIQYSKNRKNQIENAWKTSASENQQFLARRVAEVEAELARMKTGQKTDQDQA